MAKYKAYPEYKDSGVEWLGELPAHWTTLAIKHVAQLNPSKSCISIEKMKGMCSFIPMEKLKFNSLCLDEIKDVTDVYNGYTYFENEDILIAKVTPCFENKNMVVAHDLNNGIGFGSSEIYVLRCNDIINNDFLFYRLQEDNFMSIAEGAMTGAGGLKRVPSEVLNNFKFGLPSKKEQSIIVDFLKHETAKIDNLIEKQQQLIELLKEKRQAVISHAVTKGLNPDVPMKDSGVEWLGEVPKHWKCGYLRWYISVSSGTYLNNKEFETDESNDCMNPVIGGNGVMGFTSKTNDGNCLVVGRVGALCGNVHQIRRSCWVTDNALKITYGCDFDVDYLEMYLKVLDLNKLANHNAQPLITGTMIKEQVAIIPPIDEQKNITKFIQSKVGKIDLLILKSSEAVDKIKERRTALISAAVTGKIDVRDWVAPDTQNAEEQQEATA